MFVCCKYRWSNPVLDRLTGGTGHLQSVLQSNSRTLPIMSSSSSSSSHNGGLRNESYYIATNDNWSPTVLLNNSVLIEEDPEPVSP